MAQKVLVHSKRSREDRAKDTLYIHDTLEAFGARLADLHTEWVGKVGRRSFMGLPQELTSERGRTGSLAYCGERLTFGA